MMSKNDDIWGILGRYFDHSMTKEDEILLKQWLKKNKENRQTLEFIEEVLRSKDDKTDEEFFSKLNADEDWASVAAYLRKSQVNEKQEKIHILQQKRKKQQTVYTFLKVAVLLLIGFTSAYLTLEFVYTPRVEAEQQEMAVLEEVFTNRGERANITLGDGTKVSLNVDSKLLIPRKFGDDQRKVILEGEAFFDVKEDHSRPFLIESYGSATEVLGTSFGVRSYESDREVHVVVKSGTVALKKMEHRTDQNENPVTVSENRVLLQAGDVGVFNKHDLSITSEISEDPEDLLGWMENRLIFREASLEEIFQTLERWFDVTIRSESAAGELSEKRITLNMRKGHIRDVLELLGESADIRYEILEDATIIIR